MVAFIQLDEFFEERIAFRIWARSVRGAQNYELSVKRSHFLYERQVLLIEGLYLLRQRVVVSSLTFLELIIRFLLICLGFGRHIEVILLYDSIHLSLHLKNFSMSYGLQAITKVLTELVLNISSVMLEVS